MRSSYTGCRRASMWRLWAARTDRVHGEDGAAAITAVTAIDPLGAAMDGPQLVAFEFDRVTVRRAGRRVLDEVTACIPAAGITVISGPSGAGKTTLLRLCN